jgi:hypothetical protein
MLELRDKDYEEWRANQLFTQTCTNQTISWLVHSWNTFGAQMNHGQTHTYKTHNGPDLAKATNFPFIISFVLGHRANTQMSFCPKILEIGTPTTLEAHNFVCIPLIEVRFEKSCSPRWDLSNNMSHMERKLGRFLTFSGRKSNWQLDPQPFFWP